MTVHLTKFDIKDHLNSEEDRRLALQAACEEDPGDGSLICAALEDIAEFRGMSSLAQKAGISRENLYGNLSGKGSSEFAAVSKDLKSM